MSEAFHNDLAESLKLKTQKESVGSKESRVLIIYTGGTIGMKQSDHGYVPVPNVFHNALRSNPRFHDPEEHSRRLQTLNYTDDNYITPESYYKKRIIFKLIELPKLIDSSCIQMSNWIEIAETVERFYYDYDGFVVLHGTDTMAYTASVLSFIMENLQKPIIVTGAQIPYFEVRTDASKNLLEALTIAGHFSIPEVCLFFNDKLFRGNRCTKIDNSNFESFSSPNYSHLVKAGITYKVKWDQIRHPRVEGRFRLQTSLEENISILHFFPIITLDTIRSATQPPTRAVIILSYGSGNIPSNRPEFLEEIKNAADRGVILVNITQCHIGGTSAHYECGRILKNAGVVLGCDMTLECALTKISYLLGKYPNQPAIIKKLLRENLRGELTPDDDVHSFSFGMQRIMESIGNSLGVYSLAERKEIIKKCLTMLTHDAAYEGHIQDLKKMAEDNVSMEMKDQEGRTLLHIACRTGSLPLVEFLLQQRVMINPVDIQGNTPLMLAIQRDFIKIAEKLIENGADIRSKPEVIANLLSEAAYNGNQMKIRLMNMAGVNLNLFDFQGRTVAHAAVINCQVGVIRYLKGVKEFNWSCRDVMGLTPKLLAEKMGFEEIVGLLKDEI
jgi:60kDa lysophospholipase